MKKRLLFFPPAYCWSVAAEMLGSEVAWGAQNVAPQLEGAYTGENSARVLGDLGGSWALVGHSERRHVFMEQDDLVSQKVALLESCQIKVVLCVGETLQQKQQGDMESVLAHQLETGLSLSDKSSPKVIAYEPVWAIGSGLSAEASEVSKVHEWIHDFLRKKNFVGDISIWYGGSVNSSNVASFDRNYVQGFLVGSGSLSVESFWDLINCSEGKL